MSKSEAPDEQKAAHPVPLANVQQGVVSTETAQSAIKQEKKNIGDNAPAQKELEREKNEDTSKQTSSENTVNNGNCLLLLCVNQK